MTCLWAQLLSAVWLFGTSWSVAHQAPLSMGLSPQEYWVGCYFLFQVNLPNSGMEPLVSYSFFIASKFFTTETSGIYLYDSFMLSLGFPGDSNGRSVCLQWGRPGFDPWVRKIWRRKWQPTPVLLPGKFHGWRSLVAYSPWGRKESDTTERLHFHFSLSCRFLPPILFLSKQESLSKYR